MKHESFPNFFFSPPPVLGNVYFVYVWLFRRGPMGLNDSAENETHILYIIDQTVVSRLYWGQSCCFGMVARRDPKQWA